MGRQQVTTGGHGLRYSGYTFSMTGLQGQIITREGGMGYDKLGHDMYQKAGHGIGQGRAGYDKAGQYRV